MERDYYAGLADDQLFELLFMAEDRLPREAAEEAANRDGLAPYIGQVVMDKQSWLAELPDWWAVVHGTYILGLRGGEESVLPLMAVLRWSDAFDCDWVTELLPSIFGSLGSPAIPWLTAAARDAAAGWSARDLALRSLASIGHKHPSQAEHVFRVIGERFMDEGEERLVRQLAGQILLDFRHQGYRMALIKFAREEFAFREVDYLYPAGLDPEEVEAAYRQGEPELWHYEEDWMRFYEPGEIQRRLKRWTRERLGTTGRSRSQNPPSGGGARVLPLFEQGKPPEPQKPSDSGEKGPYAPEE
ncbi:MAG: hypothetical protein KQH53_15385 [Desulfarculaceae bacterium]|nr:hypothetical protein [Desulfarculaceae bacterium]